MKHDPKAKEQHSAEAFPPKEGSADALTKEKAAVLVGASDNNDRDAALNTMFKDLFYDVKAQATSSDSGDTNG